MENITIRNYRMNDFDRYAQLLKETETVDRSGRYVSNPGLAEELSRPNYFPETDLFVAEIDTEIIGYISVTLEPGIGRALLDCLVHPRHRRKGTAGKLFTHAVRRARDSGVGVSQISIPETNAAGRSLVTHLGFGYIRRFLELRLNMLNIPIQDVNYGSFLCRSLLPGEEELLTKLQNTSFVGTWGFNPNTNEEIGYQLNRRGCSLEDVRLIFLADNPVGYCWTMVNSEANAVRGEKKGKIHMLGVDPDYRNKNIGKLALSAGLSFLKRREIHSVELTVDGENMPARRLYDSQGFEVRSVTQWYEKGLI
ncbi:MAG: GNAT family N-acetyltransferase [Desulfobacterales bacterium]